MLPSVSYRNAVAERNEVTEALKYTFKFLNRVLGMSQHQKLNPAVSRRAILSQLQASLQQLFHLVLFQGEQMSVELVLIAFEVLATLLAGDSEQSTEILTLLPGLDSLIFDAYIGPFNAAMKENRAEPDKLSDLIN